MIWVRFCLFFSKHFKVSFAIRAWDTERVQDACSFLCHQSKNVVTACSVRAHWHKIFSCQFRAEPGSTSAHVLMRFLFSCIPFHLVSVSCKGRITDTHWKRPHQAVKILHFWNINKVYGIQCAVNYERYIVSYHQHMYLYVQRKAQMRTAVPLKTEKGSLIYIVQSETSSVLLSFTFLCFCDVSEKRRSLLSLPVKVG